MSPPPQLDTYVSDRVPKLTLGKQNARPSAGLFGVDLSARAVEVGGEAFHLVRFHRRLRASALRGAMLSAAAA